jgi:small GTP-binding protein
MSTPEWAKRTIKYARQSKTTVLDLSRTLDEQHPLETIPEDVFDLTLLTTLILNNNRLTNLPKNIVRLQNLTGLFLINNNIAVFPNIVTNLRNLRGLYLSQNQIKELPEDIIKLNNLTILDLRNNKLKTLPNLIAELPDLVGLPLTDNPLITPPIEIATKGIKAIHEYFRQLQDGQDYLYEAKLLLLGEGGAGKTTLAKKIENPDYRLREEESTQGIDVLQWSFPMLNGKSFRVNIWDFGGQEIYHTTHQFFLTKRSLYALVADTRKEDTDFYYWMNVIELLSDNSPLLIVKNEKQDRHREINERQLRSQFENLKSVLATNLATNLGLDKVLDEIKHYIIKLPHIGSPLPRTWVRVREQLEKDPRNHIGLDEYLGICKSNGFMEEKDSLQLSNYLHDIGVFLHFQDDPLLNKTVILKPTWGTQAVYKVLDNPTVISNLGHFTSSDLANIWKGSEYSNMRDELLQLMMKFKLCYKILNADGLFIAPQLLTENHPNYPWDHNDNLFLRYTYDFMPKGILTQFIVALHSNIASVNNQSVVWKSGVVLSKNRTAAEVVEYYGKREIHIRVAGAHKKELLTIIIHELDKIHNTYKRLKHDKLIPCSCDECKISHDPFFHKHEQLQKFIEKGINGIQCGATGNLVDVHGLIDDVFEKVPMHNEYEAPVVQYNVYGNYIDEGEKMTEKKSISINNSTVYGSVVAAETIKDSFNLIEQADIKEDLKEQLKQLTQAVGEMIKVLPKEQADEVADDMKKLADEATKQSPNKKWYSVSIQGLTKAAENLGNIGIPVIKLAGKILAILSTR